MTFKPIVFKNKAYWTNTEKFLFGCVTLIDSLIRILSLGRYCTSLPVETSRLFTKTAIKRKCQSAQ